MIHLPWGEANLLALAVATVAKFFLGGLWYSPVLFGKRWMTLMGIQREEIQKENVNVALALSVLTIAVGGYVLSVFMAATGNDGPISGALMGALVSIGFMSTAIGMNHAFEGKGLAFYGITIGNHVVGFTMMGAILGAF